MVAWSSGFAANLGLHFANPYATLSTTPDESASDEAVSGESAGFDTGDFDDTGYFADMRPPEPVYSSADGQALPQASPARNPLLHLWSLGVEEQFYFVWPLVVQRAHACASPKSGLALFLSLFLVSFALNIWQCYSDTAGTAAYYLPVTRFFEIIAGAALSWCELQDVLSNTWLDGAHDRGLSVRNGLGMVGAIMLVIAFSGTGRCSYSLKS
jgi:hypothetical protein